MFFTGSLLIFVLLVAFIFAFSLSSSITAEIEGYVENVEPLTKNLLNLTFRYGPFLFLFLLLFWIFVLVAKKERYDVRY